MFFDRAVSISSQGITLFDQIFDQLFYSKKAENKII